VIDHFYDFLDIATESKNTGKDLISNPEKGQSENSWFPDS